jgi:hypothetical protein
MCFSGVAQAPSHTPFTLNICAGNTSGAREKFVILKGYLIEMLNRDQQLQNAYSYHEVSGAENSIVLKPKTHQASFSALKKFRTSLI